MDNLNKATKNFEKVDFEKLRKKDDEDYDIDEIKETIIFRKEIIFGQFINFLNYFDSIGGFVAIVDILRVGNLGEEKLPLDWIATLTTPFKNCNHILAPEFAQKFVGQIKEIVFSRIVNMNEKELKELDKEIVGNLLI